MLSCLRCPYLISVHIQGSCPLFWCDSFKVQRQMNQTWPWSICVSICSQVSLLFSVCVVCVCIVGWIDELWTLCTLNPVFHVDQLEKFGGHVSVCAMVWRTGSGTAGMLAWIVRLRPPAQVQALYMYLCPCIRGRWRCTEQGCLEEDCGSCVNWHTKEIRGPGWKKECCVEGKCVPSSVVQVQDLKSRHKVSFFYNLLFLWVRPKERPMGPYVIGSWMIVDQ